MSSASSGEVFDKVTDTHVAVSRLNMAIWIQRALHIAVSLDVFEHMAGGPVALQDLASACGADAGALRRVLRLLAAEGFVDALDVDRFQLTSMGETMLRGSAWSARWLVMDNAVFQASASIEHAVRTGEAAFPSVHGKSFWQHLGDNRGSALAFAQKMHTQVLTMSLPTALACEWDDAGTVVDVGGGDGTLLGHLLAAHKDLRGVVVDQGESVARVTETLASLGVATRCVVCSADFFAGPVPRGDTLMVSRVLHDWGDQEARELLSRLRSSINPGGRLIVLEMILPEDDTPHPALFGDLNLLVLFGGAHERTRREFAELFASAGFEIAHEVTTRSPVVAMIAQPV